MLTIVFIKPVVVACCDSWKQMAWNDQDTRGSKKHLGMSPRCHGNRHALAALLMAAISGERQQSGADQNEPDVVMCFLAPTQLSHAVVLFHDGHQRGDKCSENKNKRKPLIQRASFAYCCPRVNMLTVADSQKISHVSSERIRITQSL